MIDCSIFDNLLPDEGKLLSSGFAYGKYGPNSLSCAYPVADGDLIFHVCISPDGSVRTSVTETENGIDTDEPFLPYNVKDASGAYIGSVNEECQAIARRIADTCFTGPAQGGLITEIADYIRKSYGAELEYLWEKFPADAIWRRPDNAKWFALIMKVPAKKLGLEGDGELDVLDLRATEDVISKTDSKTIFPAYHMNKKHWITLILDGRTDAETIFRMTDASYALAAK